RSLGERSSFEADGGLLSASRHFLGSEGAEGTEQAFNTEARRRGRLFMAEAGVAPAICGWLRVSVSPCYGLSRVLRSLRPGAADPWREVSFEASGCCFLPRPFLGSE